MRPFRALYCALVPRPVKALDPILPINPANPITLHGFLFHVYTFTCCLSREMSQIRILQDGRVIEKVLNTESSRCSFGLPQTRYRERFGSLPQPCQATIPIPKPRACQCDRATRFSLLDSLLLDAEDMLRGLYLIASSALSLAAGR